MSSLDRPTSPRRPRRRPRAPAATSDLIIEVNDQKPSAQALAQLSPEAREFVTRLSKAKLRAKVAQDREFVVRFASEPAAAVRAVGVDTPAAVGERPSAAAVQQPFKQLGERLVHVGAVKPVPAWDVLPAAALLALTLRTAQASEADWQEVRRDPGAAVTKAASVLDWAGLGILLEPVKASVIAEVTQSLVAALQWAQPGAGSHATAKAPTTAPPLLDPEVRAGKVRVVQVPATGKGR